MITGWDKTGPQLYYVDNDATRIHGHRIFLLLITIRYFMVQCECNIM